LTLLSAPTKNVSIISKQDDPDRKIYCLASGLVSIASSMARELCGYQLNQIGEHISAAVRFNGKLKHQRTMARAMKTLGDSQRGGISTWGQGLYQVWSGALGYPDQSNAGWPSDGDLN